MLRLMCCALVTAALAGCSRPAGSGPQKLVVGMELAYPPFEMTDAAGAPAGVSVDLARDLGKFLGREVEIRNTPFSGLIPALKTGQLNLIVSSMTATEERAQSIDFSDPYVTTGLCLLIGRGSPVTDAASLDQPGRTVAVKQGTTGHLYASKQLKQAKVLVLDKETACVLEVKQGKADAFIYDQLSVYRNWARDRESFRPNLAPFQAESWAVGLRKGDEDLRAKVNAFLKHYRATGGFDRLSAQWLAEEKTEFVKLGYPFLF